jgi:hypothetical protein
MSYPCRRNDPRNAEFWVIRRNARSIMLKLEAQVHGREVGPTTR